MTWYNRGLRFVWRTTLLMLGVALIGCTDINDGANAAVAAPARCSELDDTRGFATTDSAGVEVVTNLSPEWDTSDAAHLSAAPFVTIGVTRGDAAYEFGRISAATMLTDGRIIVGDGQAAELKIFDPEGRFMQAVGGRGSGPGEYRSISAVIRTPGDTLWVDDLGNRRITKLDPTLAALEVIRLKPIRWSVPAEEPGGRPLSRTTALRLKGALADGTLIAANSLRGGGTEEVTNVSRDSLILRRVHPGREVTDSVGLILGSQRFEVFLSNGTLVFGNALLGHVESLAVAHDRYYYGSGERFEIEERTPDGSLVRLIRLCEEAEMISDERLDQVINARLATFTSEELTYEEPALRELPRPTVAPSFLELLMDMTGRLWVRDFTYPGDPQRWKLFNREGRWLGDVLTPADLTILEVGPGYVLGRHASELDIQSIRVVALSLLE